MYEFLGVVCWALSIGALLMFATWAGTSVSELKQRQYGSGAFIAVLSGLAFLIMLWSFNTGMDMFERGERVRAEERARPVPPPPPEKQYRFRCTINGKTSVESAWYKSQGTISDRTMRAPSDNEVYEFRTGELCRWEWRNRPAT